MRMSCNWLHSFLCDVPILYAWCHPEYKFNPVTILKYMYKIVCEFYRRTVPVISDVNWLYIPEKIYWLRLDHVSKYSGCARINGIVGYVPFVALTSLASSHCMFCVSLRAEVYGMNEFPRKNNSSISELVYIIAYSFSVLVCCFLSIINQLWKCESKSLYIWRE